MRRRHDMGSRTSTFVILWVNFFTLVVAVGVMGTGLWMSTRHGNSCDKFLAMPVLAFGGFVFLISVVGFLGSLKDISILLWIYLILMFFLLVSIASFTVFAFLITNSSSGHSLPDQRYKEYRLEDYSHWFQNQLKNRKQWKYLRGCLVKHQDCKNLIREYKTLKQYKQAKLSPIEAGCCRPPSECGFPPRNASYYDLSFHPVSSNKDCKIYRNKQSIRCYSCNSCKAGVAEYLKREWKIGAIFNIVAFSILVLLYCVGCYARRNASHAHSLKKASNNLNLNELQAVQSVL